MQLFPVNYITYDSINFSCFAGITYRKLFLFLPPLLLNPSSTCKAHWDIIVQSTNGSETLLFTNHT